MNIIGKKWWYFLFSLIIIIPGMISLVLYGLNLSIDFAGGSRMTFLFPKTPNQITNSIISGELTKNNIKIGSIQPAGKQLFIRTSPLDQKTHAKVLKDLQKTLGDFKEESYETIGPTVSSETTWNAVKAVLVSSALIVLYIAWSFRKVPKPASSWRFGVCAVVALLHDVLVVIGIFSLLGHFWHVEVDSLFVTAILTVIGFSVHDTIVVFDRIRENLQRSNNPHFSEVVNDSIVQTLGRSLNTSFTVVLVLLSLLLFGGESIRWFIVALLIGVTSGTYSSIFNAAPLLVVWGEWSREKIKK